MECSPSTTTGTSLPSTEPRNASRELPAGTPSERSASTAEEQDTTRENAGRKGQEKVAAKEAEE